MKLPGDRGPDQNVRRRAMPLSEQLQDYLPKVFRVPQSGPVALFLSGPSRSCRRALSGRDRARSPGLLSLTTCRNALVRQVRRLRTTPPRLAPLPLTCILRAVSQSENVHVHANPRMASLRKDHGDQCTISPHSAWPRHCGSQPQPLRMLLFAGRGSGLRATIQRTLRPTAKSAGLVYFIRPLIRIDPARRRRTPYEPANCSGALCS